MNFSRYLLFFCGQVGMMMQARFFFMWINEFTTGSEDTPALLATGGMLVLLFGFRLFDSVTDPVAGAVSNAWIRRGNKRQQLLWFSFLLPAGGLVVTFLPTAEMAPALRWACVSIGMLFFFVGYTFYAIPYWSLVGDYAAGDARRRRILSNLLGGGIVLAVGIGFIGSGILIDKVGYAPAAAVFGLCGSALMVLPYFAAPPDAQMTSAGPAGASASMLHAFGIAFRHRRFLALLALFAGSQMSFTLMTSAAPYIAQDLLDGTKGDIARVMGPLLGTAAICFLITPKISEKIGWLRGMLYASAALAVVYALSSALGEAVIGDRFLTASILFALGGPMVAVLMGLEGEGIVDCAEERGGGDLIGMYWGVFNFVVKLLNGLALALGNYLGSQAKPDAWGEAAIRAMSMAAGALLLCGVAAYFIIKPGRATPAA